MYVLSIYLYGLELCVKLYTVYESCMHMYVCIYMYVL